MENTTLLVKQQRLAALAVQWERDPKFKEYCRLTWKPEEFQDVERRIELLREIDKIEARHTKKGAPVYLDISEIDVKAWEAQWYDKN